MTPRRPIIRIAADIDALSLTVAEAVVDAIAVAVEQRGRCSIVLSGGSTPRTLYLLLGSMFRDRIPWAHVDVFWADERYVPADDPNSNTRMARATLLDHVPCPSSHIHAMPTTLDSADDAAIAYERIVRDFFASGTPAFDLVVLGMGEEGHTASLFPHSPALRETSRWVVAVEVPAHPRQRLTLTMRVLTEAASIFVITSGATKAAALQHVLGETPDVMTYPASGLRDARGALVWWMDQDAASRLPADLTR